MVSKRFGAGSAVVVVALVAALLGAAPSAAVPGASDKDTAPVLCSGHSIENRFDQVGRITRWVRIWVPAGATLTATPSGLTAWGAPNGTTWSSKVGYFVKALNEDITNGWDTGHRESGVHVTGGPKPPPREWTNVAPLVLTNTSSSQLYYLRIETEKYYSDEYEYELKVEVAGGNGDEGPPCIASTDSESFGPNASTRHQCAAKVDEADPCDMGTGNLHMPVPGLSVPGRGPGLDFSLGYNSGAAATDSSTGFGWSSTLDMRMATLPDGSRQVVQETGATVRFDPDGSGGWTAPDRFSADLASNGNGTSTFTRNHFDEFLFDDTDGRLLSMSDQFDNTTTVHYLPGSTEADYMEDPAGRRLTFGWSGGRVSSVTDQLSGSGGPRSLSFGYDGSGDLTSYTDATGGVWTFIYDGEHRMETMVKPRHQGTTKSIENGYDWKGRVAWQEDELDRRTTFGYDQPTVGTTTVELPGGRLRTHRFDNGLRVETVDGAGTADATSTTFAYDQDTWALTSVTDNAGRVTSFTNDAAGNRLSATDPSGRVTRWTYNSFDQVTSSAVGETAAPLPASTAEVVTDSFSFDGSGRLTSTVQASGTPAEATTTFGYDPTHPEDVVSITDPRSKVWTFGYDSATGDQTSATDPLGNTTTTAYNNVGWPLVETSPKGVATAGGGDFETSYTYDLATRTTTVTGPTGDVSSTVLDANGNTVSVATGITGANPTGDVTTYSYTDADELAAVDAPGPGAKAYEYWPGGERKRFTNESGAHYDYGYDAAGRLTSETDPLGRVTGYGYDTGGRLATVTQPGAGSTCSGTKVGCVTYSYDDAARIVGIDYSDPATADVTGITYDGLGRRTAATSNSVTETWGWDQQSRLVAHSDANGRTTGYGWDVASNLTSITYPGQTTPVARVFDDAGRLESVTDWEGRTTSFGYDANSNWTDTTFPAASTNTDSYGYDDADRMTSVSWDKGAAVIGSEDYTRPLKGMVDTATPTGDAGTTPVSYGYDDRDRLTTANTDTYVYDVASNLTETPDGRLQVFDPAQQLCWSSPTAGSGDCETPAADATVYSYDERGNRAAETGPDGRLEAVHGFDQANRLTSATVEAPPSSAGTFTAVEPDRLLDTRSGSPLAGGNELDLQVTGAVGVPSSGVSAVSVSVTAMDPSGTGFVAVYPEGVARPHMRSLSYTSGEDFSNRITVQVSASGEITLYASSTTDLFVEVHGWYADATGPTGAGFHPITPERVLDTRPASHTTNCPSEPNNDCDHFSANRTTTVQVAGAGSVPAEATAVSANLTVHSPTSSGYVKAYRSGPTITGIRNLSFESGRTTSNSGEFQLSADGRLDVFSNQNIGLLVDVYGYYLDDGSGGATYVPLEPTRLVKTTTGEGPCPGGCAAITGPGEMDVQVAGEAGMPEHGVVALAATITTLNGSGTTGAVFAYPNGEPRPPYRTVAVQAGRLVSNFAIIELGDDGAMEIYASGVTGNVDLYIDIHGYYAHPYETTNYHYNADGLRSAKTHPDTSRTEYTWTATGGLPLLLGEHTGTDTTAIIHGPGGQPIAQINPDNTALWLHHDQLGSIRAATDETGDVVSARSWDPYGNPATNTGPGPEPILGYAGEYTDPETGHIYLRARYYDPTTAQFLGADPIAPVTEEPYSYASNNPTTLRDPTGLFGWSDVSGALDSVGESLTSFGNELVSCQVEALSFAVAVTAVQ